MVAHQFPRSRFENKLRLEADRLLEDLLFLRSPVQSRLLNYLVDRSLNHLPPPSQYEIAVDGLGKDADYDLSSDSYPRVQISRLRKNLDNYYARNLPLEDLRIALKPATYELTLIAPASPHKGVAFKADAANIVKAGQIPGQQNPGHNISSDTSRVSHLVCCGPHIRIVIRHCGWRVRTTIGRAYHFPGK